jgi:hypothetical protein
MVAVSGCRVSASADWMAEQAVSCERVSGAQFPDLQGKYREFAEFEGVAAHRGAKNAWFPGTLGEISLGPGTGNDGSGIRELPTGNREAHEARSRGLGRLGVSGPRPRSRGASRRWPGARFGSRTPAGGASGTD